MTEQPSISIADAAATLPDPKLGNGACREADALCDRILADPNLGPNYLATRFDAPVRDMSAEGITEALMQHVKGDPVVADYVEQLLELAATHPAVKADPDQLLPRLSLERQAIDFIPKTNIIETEAPEAIVGRVREAGL